MARYLEKNDFRIVTTSVVLDIELLTKVIYGWK